MAMTETAKRGFLEAGPGIMSEQSGAGVALIVLGILALAALDPAVLDSIAVIVGGVALMTEGASLSVRYARMLRLQAREEPVRQSSGGLNAGALGGAAGVVLGILAILGIATDTLIPIALVVFGAAVLLDFAAKAQIRALGMADSERTALVGGSDNTASILVGIALITLGILGLAHLQPTILAAAAFLALGTYLLLDSAASSGLLADLIG